MESAKKKAVRTGSDAEGGGGGGMVLPSFVFDGARKRVEREKMRESIEEFLIGDDDEGEE